MFFKDLSIFVGHDHREQRTFNVCEYSLKKKATIIPDIHPIKHKELRDKGLFTREWKIDAKGQYWDILDGKPFSTQFSHTRFLTPTLAFEKKVKSDVVIFVDCDFVALSDPYTLFREAEAALKNKPVAVVKHNFNPSNTVKMDGMAQTTYSKKLWSSLMAFNLSHPDIKNLSPEAINTKPGSYFHQFEWVTGGEENIGSLNERWNFIPGHSESRVALYDIGMIHYTNGTPELPGYEDCDYGYIFKEYEEELMYDRFIEAGKNLYRFPRK